MSLGFRDDVRAVPRVAAGRSRGLACATGLARLLPAAEPLRQYRGGPVRDRDDGRAARAARALGFSAVRDGPVQQPDPRRPRRTDGAIHCGDGGAYVWLGGPASPARPDRARPVDGVRILQPASTVLSLRDGRCAWHRVLRRQHDRRDRADDDGACALLELDRRRRALALSDHAPPAHRRVVAGGHLAHHRQPLPHRDRRLYRHPAVPLPPPAANRRTAAGACGITTRAWCSGSSR